MSKYPKPTKKRHKKIHITKIIREEVFNRDEGLCRLREKGCENMAVDQHHIIFRKYGNDTSYNLLCVCRSCHDTIHANNKKYFPILFNMQKEIYPNLTKEMLKK